MKRLWIVVLMTLLVSCAHVTGRRAVPTGAPADLWHEAHVALYHQDFAGADSLFAHLAEAYPNTDQGREALFYSGSIHLDPRNLGLETQRAETQLRQYLNQDTVGTLIHRRPEATMLLELARQLNLPLDDRVPALRDAGTGGTATTPRQPPTQPQRPLARSEDVRALQEEVDRLSRLLLQRDEQIRRQTEELERIRRALAPRATAPSSPPPR